MNPPFFDHLGHPVEDDAMTDDQRAILSATEQEIDIALALESDLPGELDALLAELTRRGWWVEIRTPFQPGTQAGALYWAGLTPLGTTGWNGRPDVHVGDLTLRGALSRAVLLALSMESR